MEESQETIKKRSFLKPFSKRILDIILPPHCLLCKNTVEENGSLCSSCWSDMDFISKTSCSICSTPFEFDVGEDSLCASCIKERPIYDRSKTVFIYNDKSRKLITGFKYEDKIHAAKSFAKWLFTTGKDLVEESDLIIPVPLHRIRLFTRRYNQSSLIAAELAKQVYLPVAHDVLIRKKNNKPQASLPRNQRLKNVIGAFAVKEKCKNLIEGKNILLIDDVMTTSATVSECAKVLKKNGAAKVNILTLAKTVR